MSNNQFAFIKRSSVPNREALQASVDALGFDLKLHPEFDPTTDSGFLPFTLDGEEGPGFEVFYSDTNEVAGDDEDFMSLAQGRDYCISMVWRSSMKDLACVMIVSCALTKDFDAIVSYEGEAPESLDNMLEATRGILKDAAGEA